MCREDPADIVNIRANFIIIIKSEPGLVVLCVSPVVHVGKLQVCHSLLEPPVLQLQPSTQ